MANTSLHVPLSEELKQEALEQAEKKHFSDPTEYIRQDVLKAKAREEFSSFIKKGMASPTID